MTGPLDVVVIGPLNIDLIINGSAPRDIDTLLNWMALSEVTLNVAGSGGCPAQAMQAVGLKTGIVSVVPDDALGDVIRRGLADQKIDTTGVHLAPGEETAIGIYMLLFGSKKRPLTGRSARHKPWPDPLDADDLRYLSAARLIHIAGYLHYASMWDDDIPALLRGAQARGQLVSLDPQYPFDPVEGRWLKGIEALLPNVDILLVDQAEAHGITGLDDLDAAGRFLQPFLRPSGPSIVVIKRGADGALVFSASERFEQPAVHVPESEISDSIGAGDSFDAGFLAMLLRNRSPREAAAFASAVAALSLRGPGVSSLVAASGNIDRLVQEQFGYHAPD